MLMVKTDLAALSEVPHIFLYFAKKKIKKEQVRRGRPALWPICLNPNRRDDLPEPRSIHPLPFSSLGLSAALAGEEKVLV